METLKLYDELRRMLEYSGKQVKGISLTVDGAVGVVSDGLNQYTIMISKTVPRLKAVK